MEKNAPRGFFKIEDVLSAAQGRWDQVLSWFDVRTELLTNRHGPCPGCGGKDRFRFDAKDGEGTFICSQGGGGVVSGNGLALLQHVTGWDFIRSCEELGRKLLREDDRVVRHPERGEPVPRDEMPRDGAA